MAHNFLEDELSFMTDDSEPPNILGDNSLLQNLMTNPSSLSQASFSQTNSRSSSQSNSLNSFQFDQFQQQFSFSPQNISDSDAMLEPSALPALNVLNQQDLSFPGNSSNMAMLPSMPASDETLKIKTHGVSPRHIDEDVDENELNDPAYNEDDASYPNHTFYREGNVKKILKNLKEGKYKEEELIVSALMRNTNKNEDMEIATDMSNNPNIKKIVLRRSDEVSIPRPYINPSFFTHFAKTKLPKILTSFVCQWRVDFKFDSTIPLMKILFTNRNLTELRMKADDSVLNVVAANITHHPLRMLELNINTDKLEKAQQQRENNKKPGNATAFENLCQKLKPNKTLMELNLKNSTFGADDMKFLGELFEANHHITSLDLYNSELDSKDLDHLFNSIAKNRGLKILELSKNRDGSRYRHHYADPGRTEHVHRRREEMPIYPMKANALLALGNLFRFNKTLEKLNLENCGTDASTPIIPFGETLAFNTSLTNLDLSCNLSPQQFQNISSSATIIHNLKTLIMRNIVGCVLTERTLAFWLFKNSTLRVLNLANSKVHYSAIEYLSRVLMSNECKLVYLNLSHVFPKQFDWNRQDNLDRERIAILKKMFEALAFNKTIIKLDMSNNYFLSPELQIVNHFFANNPKHQLQEWSMTVGAQGWWSHHDDYWMELKSTCQDFLTV